MQSHGSTASLSAALSNVRVHFRLHADMRRWLTTEDEAKLGYFIKHLKEMDNNRQARNDMGE